MHRMRRALPLAIFIACQTPPPPPAPPPAQVRPPDLGTRPDMAVKRFMPKTMGEARTLALMSDWEQRMGHDRALDLMLEASAYIRRRASEIEYSLHRPVLDKDGRAADVARELRDLRQLVTRKHKDPAAARRAIMAEMGNELGVVVMGTEFESVQKQADIFMAIGLAR